MSQRLPILDTQRQRKELPTVRALEALWHEVSDRPLWAPPNFFRYIKLRWSTRLKLLKPNQVPVLAPKGQINDCTGCTELCCVGPKNTVLLRFRDIATLIDLERTELMTQAKPSFGAAELRANPGLRLQVSSRDWARFPVLAKNSFGACEALAEDGRCTLYPDWPLSCARFPYSLDIEARDITYSKRCRSFWIRPDGEERAEQMAAGAVAAYNERVKDRILLAYAPKRLAELGLLKFLL
ncbi:MAG: YkgJ family cysteine cluster protein [Myxococcota bacterium]